MKKVLVVADAMSEEFTDLSWDGRAQARKAIAALGECETVTTPYDGRYTEPVSDEAMQNVDLLIVHLGTILGEGCESPETSSEAAAEWVIDLFTGVVDNNRNAQVLTIVDSESDKKHQKQELLRILLLREFDIGS